jgi:MATE family multidrug resistance protein
MDRHDLRRHARDLTRQAAPVVVARSGVMLLALVDTVMVGRFAAEELAVLGLALTLVTTLLLTGIGLLMGTLVLTAAAHGAGRDGACGVVWRRSLVYAVGLGAVMAGVALAGEPILVALGQTPAMAAATRPVVAVLGLGVLPQLLFVTSQFFLEGIRRPLPGMLLMLAANVLNVALNAVLVYGMVGVPALGALGSAWATTLVRVFLAVAVIAYITLVMADRRRFLARAAADDRAAAPAGLQRRVGYAAGVSIGVEGAAFGMLGIFAGWLGPLPLAAFTIGLNLIAFVFMIAVGFGAATAVQVGAARGRGNAADARLAGWTGVALASLVLGAIAIGIALAPAALLALYTDDPALRQVALPVVAFLALVVVADGWQGVLAGAVRGLADTWVASGLHAACFVVVMVPAAWLLAVRWERGPLGLFEAMLVGCLAASAVLALRFARLTRPGRGAPRLSSAPGDG